VAAGNVVAARDAVAADNVVAANDVAARDAMATARDVADRDAATGMAPEHLMMFEPWHYFSLAGRICR